MQMKLGAVSCMMVVFFADGEYLHMIDGGTAPMPPGEVFAKCAAAYAIASDPDGESGTTIQ